MAKKITIQIPEPCNEDWNQMSPDGLGKHCESCAKTVVDFTARTDKFIASYFKEHDNICGRFRPDQLNRPIDLSARRNSVLPPLAASFILPLAMLAAGSAYSQQQSSTQNNPSYVSLNIGSQKQQIYKDIKGVVTDTAGNPMPGVRVTILETNDQIQTDNKGTYRLKAQVGHTLRFSSYLYLTEEIQVHEHQDVYSFALQYSPEHLPEVVVVAQVVKKEARAVSGFTVTVTETETTTTNTVKEVLENKAAVCGLNETATDVDLVAPIAKDSIYVTPAAKIIKVESILMDAEGIAIPFEKVAIAGTQAAVYTDADGYFRTDLRPTDELIFEVTNFKPVTLKASEIQAETVLDRKWEKMIMGGVIYGIEITYEGVIPWYRIGYNHSENFNGNPKLQAEKARNANTVAFERIQREKKKQARKNNQQ
ncbi:carboxypeptidase-like regulatory domain-containing protein [Gilvibacter sediminis]|uniref:carboxypeptidase-like regulatory domain-containing protein n=1 Tax=Gilvibacter sediminis TaxID=379071 RepID=UPI0023500F3D|nr:carboxypeptidase-like regulatory domain-containing protein [Gilvibacter sediminis]MDC7997886.1 carboxypeptidase-like regulatory domain-containing protein [Gilvibacter sediminis]